MTAVGSLDLCLAWDGSLTGPNSGQYGLQNRRKQKDELFNRLEAYNAMFHMESVKEICSNLREIKNMFVEKVLGSGESRVMFR